MTVRKHLDVDKSKSSPNLSIIFSTLTFIPLWAFFRYICISENEKCISLEISEVKCIISTQEFSLCRVFDHFGSSQLLLRSLLLTARRADLEINSYIIEN